MTTNHRFPVVEMQLAMRPVDELGTVITGHVAKGKMSSPPPPPRLEIFFDRLPLNFVPGSFFYLSLCAMRN